MFYKIWHKVYSQIQINSAQVESLKSLLHEKKDNYILVPTHKSYMDFILLAFVHYYYQVEYPFVCGEETLFQVSFFRHLIKSSGAFKMNREQLSKS